jgi:tRNA threonylcarbamoyladenosine biosynthesis protein TsaB
VKILAIDTATRLCSVALMEDKRLVAENLLYGHKNHSEKLLRMIHGLLSSSQIAPELLDLIAVSIGPGSFTGLRVGISTAQGLAFSFEKKLIGISSLELLAEQIYMYNGLICPMLDARKQQIYTCLYKRSYSGSLEKIIGDTVILPEAWAAQLPGPVICTGSGASLYRETLSKVLPNGSTFVPEYYGIPRASTLAFCAHEKYAYNEENMLLDNILPMYLRLPDAATHNDNQ